MIYLCPSNTTAENGACGINFQYTDPETDQTVTLTAYVQATQLGQTYNQWHIQVAGGQPVTLYSDAGYHPGSSISRSDNRCTGAGVIDAPHAARAAASGGGIYRSTFTEAVAIESTAPTTMKVAIAAPSPSTGVISAIT